MELDPTRSDPIVCSIPIVYIVDSHVVSFLSLPPVGLPAAVL